MSTATGPTAVQDLLDSLLALAADALDDALEAEAAPEARYIAHGRVMVTPGCPELSVLCSSITPKLVDPRSEACAVILQTSMTVTLLRCVPHIGDKSLPSPAERSAANRQLAVDGWVLEKGLTRGWADGIWPIGINCRRVTWLPGEPIPPEAGMAGWRINVRVDMA